MHMWQEVIGVWLMLHRGLFESRNTYLDEMICCVKGRSTAVTKL